jgi:hypothetical protein
MEAVPMARVAKVKALDALLAHARAVSTQLTQNAWAAVRPPATHYGRLDLDE